MKIPHYILVKLSPLVELARGEPLVAPFLEVTEDDEDRLFVRSSYGEFLFEKRTRAIVKDGFPLCGFGQVVSVDMGSFPGGLGEKSWSIELFRSLVDRVTVARTYDDGEASVVAAKLARTLGCKVIAFNGLR